MEAHPPIFKLTDSGFQRMLTKSTQSRFDLPISGRATPTASQGTLCSERICLKLPAYHFPGGAFSVVRRSKLRIDGERLVGF